MAKKGGGGKSSFWDNPFGGMADFNHDGKESFSEQWLALKIFEECTKTENHHDHSNDYIYHSVLGDDDISSTDTSWRDFCEDGSDVFIDPEDYETEDEYNEALEEERSAWRDFCEGGSEYGLDPEDYDTEDEYMEALEKAQDNADKSTEIEYLSNDGVFLYAQAIKDNFQLPISLPDEDEYREYELSAALCKIAKRNIALSFEVWEWALAKFLPYTQYAYGSLSELTSDIIDNLYDFPESYRTELARYMDKHPDFMEKVVDEKAEMPSDLDALIVAALRDGLLNTALTLFKRGLVQAGDDWKKINRLTDGTISRCKNYDELESAEYFKLNMLPLVKAINIGMVQDEIDEWEKGLDDYISWAENSCEQYTYTRKNAWRKTVPDGSKYGLNPRYYDSEQKYLEALNEEKYRWREWYKDDDTLGLDVNDFETQEEFQKAYNTRHDEKYQKEREQREQEYLRLQKERQQRYEEELRIEAEKARMDDKIYTFCGVAFPHAQRPYSYRTEDLTIKVGDSVLVPVGNQEATGTVVSVGQYMRIAAPYPVDKAKFIIGKIDKKF